MRSASMLLAALVFVTPVASAQSSETPAEKPAEKQPAKDPKSPPSSQPTPSAPSSPTPTTPSTQSVPSAPTKVAPDPTMKRDVVNYNLDKNKLAIDGYDPVAYFREGGGKAMKGKKELAYTYRGVTYHFATKENRDRFKADPAKYEPTYGGWCASAIADGGRKVEIDPSNFKVTNNRLFLFYKGFLQNAKDYWDKDERTHTTDADTWWKKIAAEEPRKPDEVKKDEKKTESSSATPGAPSGGVPGKK